MVAHPRFPTPGPSTNLHYYRIIFSSDCFDNRAWRKPLQLHVGSKDEDQVLTTQCIKTVVSEFAFGHLQAWQSTD